MAQRESVEQALLRWREFEQVQELYSEFNDLLEEVMVNLMGFQVSDIQRDIGDYLVNGPQYRMIQAQRGQAKSTITAVYAVWRLIKDPKTRVLIISAGDKQAKEVATAVIQIVNHLPELECMRPDRANGDRSSVEHFDIHYSLKGFEKSPSVACIGITANLQGKRADVLIPDDIESSKNALTQLQRDNLKHRTLDFPSMCTDGDIIWLGTPQSIDSIYNDLPSRGVDIRIWPGRYPTVEQEEWYGDHLAPRIKRLMTENPELRTGGGPMGDQGQVTEDKMKILNEASLTRKEIAQRSAYFTLQHMLNTGLTDAERFPLKTTNVRFLAFDRFDPDEQLPSKFSFVRSGEHKIKLPPDHPIREDLFRIASATDPIHMHNGWHMYVDPAGGGQNGDETAYAITGFAAGRVFVAAVGGVPGGITEEALKTLTELVKRYKPRTVSTEKNFGNGALASVWYPLLRAESINIKMEEVWESGQKELRIIDLLEPVLNTGKLIVHEDIIQEDFESTRKYAIEKRNLYSMFFQMNRMTRDRGSLIHEDRLDALAGSIRPWVNLLTVDEEAVREQVSRENWERMVNDPLGTGQPVEGWNPNGNFGAVPNALNKWN